MNTRSFNYAFALLALFLFSKESIMAQGKPAALPLMIPPSPNAAALGDYGKVPVGLFTGTLQQNIPLYTITASDFSLPISLNYSSNGIKVSDAGSNVGLGWVLDAGGVITRTVNDEPDESNSGRIVLPPVDFNTQQMSDFLLQATSNNTQDSEPDVFSFNVGSYAGKFYLTGAAPAMQAVLVSPSPLKIELLSDFYTTSLTNEQIKITDPSGVVYSFGGLNGVERSDSKTYGSGGPADNPQSKLIKSAWQLYKIKLLNGDEINFTYVSQFLKYDAGISQTLSSAISYKPSTAYTVQKATHSLPKVTGVNINASKLTEINWKNGKISFAYSLRFTGGTTTMEKIDNMVISTKNNTTFTVLKKYAFNYLSVDAAAYANPDNLNGNYIDARKRLFLSDVIAQSPSGTELNRHTFEYYNHTELPNRLSYAQDYWGYFNGKTNPDLVTDDVSSYNPDYYQVVGSSFSADAIKQLFNDVGGDKKIDAQFAVKGMLKKVTYPTGGSSSFEYESHTTGKMDAVLPTTKENVSLYKSLPPDGRADVITVTTPIIPFEQYRVEFFPTVSGHCTTSPQNVNFQVTVKEIQSNTNVPLEEFDGATYSLVNTPKRILWNDLVLLTIPKRYFFTFKQGKSYTISISLLSHHTCVDAYGELNFSYYSQNTTQQWVNTPVGGMRISKITTADLTGNEQIKRYYYGSDLNNLNRSTGKARIVEPAINYFESLTSVPNGEVSEEVRTLIANLNSNPLHDLYNAQGYHITYGTVIEGSGNNFEGGATIHNFNTVTEVPPTHYRDPIMGTPFQNDFGNGEEIKTVFYKNVGVFVKVSEINRTYITDNRLMTALPAFKATKRSSSYINSAETYNLSTYGIKSQWRYLSSEAETTYDQGGANPAIATTTYQYDNALHLQPTVTTTVLENAGTGTQHSFKTTTKYPQDFTFPGTLSGSAARIKGMVDKHIWNVPIEQLKSSITGSVSRVVDGQLSTYKLNGTSIVKDKDYVLKFNNSTIYQDIITVTPSTINSSGVFVYDSHYEQLNAYNRYDAVNNLLEATDRKNTSSFIREPNSGDVWAKIANGNYTGVAYSSFEHSTASTFTNWSYNLAGIVSLVDAQNGAKAFTLSASNIINSVQTLSSAQKYKVSFWRKTSGGTTFSVKASGVTVTLRTGPARKGWQYYEGVFTGATTLQITGNATIDELRLYPQNSRLTSYVYKDGVGPLSESDENNRNTFWEYDEFNRLKLTRDQDGNILKKNEYKYQHIQN